MNPYPGRRSGLIVLSLLGIALCALPWLLSWSELPTSVTSGFALGGAEQTLSRTTTMSIVILLGVIGALGMIYAAFVPQRRDSAPPAASAAIGGLLVGLAVGVSATTVWVSRAGGDVDSTWQGLAGVLLVVATALVFSIAARWVARADSTHNESNSAQPNSAKSNSAPSNSEATHRLTLAPGEQVVWVGTATQPLLWVLTAALVIIGLAVAFTGQVVPGLVASAVGLVIGVAFSRIRVLVDRTGVTVRYTPLNWPSTHVDLTDIDAASVIDVRPRRWGGWGYRGSLKAFGSAAVVVRGGPGLRLDLTRDRTFVVTVDQPEGAQDLIAAELDRQRVGRLT